ncbi:ATP-binding protein [Aeropyrum camini]|uniref:ATP-binding protein n=1 Tax=Aeropyrum camini TaxID=229980 RepID=UPI00138F1E24|nr:ATP-binding protein [Aeropyrum camini]
MNSGRVPWVLSSVVEQRLSLLLYGPPGSGKSLIALYMGSKAVEKGLSVCHFYTPPNKPRAVVEGVIYREVLDIAGLASNLLSASLGLCSFLIVDTINELYRLEPSMESASMLAMAASAVRSSGGVATGVASARDGDESTPGYSILEPYFHFIGRVYRLGGGFALELQKPYRKYST